MDWRPAWWAGPPLLPLLLLLLLLAGQEGSHAKPQEEDYFTLGHDYPHDGQDYYSDVDYGNYYQVFVPDVANATLHKCRCEGDQVWDGATCRDVATFVAIIDYLTKQRVALNTSEFGSVAVGEVLCPAGHRKVVLDSNKDSVYEFSLLESGEVYWRDVKFPNYCIDHILDHNGEPESWMAHLCLPPPPVNLCCPEGHALLTNGTCYPSDAALNVPLSMEVEGQLLTWQIDADSVVTNLTCSPADTYYRRLSEANVSLVYDPRGVMLQWLPPTLTNRPMDRQEYCVGVEVGGPSHEPQHATLFCYRDRAAEHYEVCHNATCVRKCCPDHSLMLDLECVYVHDAHMEWTPTFHHIGSLSPGAQPPEDLTVVHGLPICDSIFKMRPDESDEDRFYLLEDGTLMVPAFSKAFPATRYCLDNFIAHDHPLNEHPLICFEDRNTCTTVQFIAYPALLAISCVFLSVTLLVYVSVPELHAKVHGKCLVSHVTALLFAYLCLLSVQLAGGRLPDGACKLMASLTHVSFLAAFFWLNVMCFDIWWTLKSMRPVAETGELSRLRFKMYSVYSWGCPVFISLVAVIVDSLPEDFDVIRPDFATKKCWFADNRQLWAYFYGFVLALVVANIILFCQVAYILIMAQNDPILQRTRQQNRERMWLYIKLFVVMGLTWITEVISWQEGSCEPWIVSDVINALQGFSIFLIFICKRNMLKRIRNNWEPYLRRMKLFFGSSRQPEDAKGKGVQDTSSFSSSVNRPSSHSNASQRTVQSQISLDATSAVRKLSTSSLVSTTGVQVHSSNSLCMDTITEAASSEAEEVSQDGDARGPGEAEATTAAQDAPTAPDDEAREALQTDVESGESQALGTQAEALEKDGETDHAVTPAGDKNAVKDATQTATHTPSGDESTMEDAAQTADQTKAGSCAAEGEAVSATPQVHYNEGFVVDDPDGQAVHV